MVPRNQSGEHRRAPPHAPLSTTSTHRRCYHNRGANLAIFAGAVVVFGISLWLVRSQETVDDISCMKAMIPHHSIAIMTSPRTHIRDPRVRRLADGVIDAQVREIGEMEQFIQDLEREPTPPGAPDLAPTR